MKTREVVSTQLLRERMLQERMEALLQRREDERDARTQATMRVSETVSGRHRGFEFRDSGHCISFSAGKEILHGHIAYLSSGPALNAWKEWVNG